MHGFRLIIFATVLPGDILESFGIHSAAAETAVNLLALIGAITGGAKVLFKTVNGARAHLETRRGEGRRRLQRRAAFASFVESRIRDLDNKEEWSDNRFAELEAEVETQGVKRKRRIAFRKNRVLRRERSLSKALINTTDQLVLLQGDPGSGKSVALRFVARKMAARTMTAKSLKAEVPLYINLKGLQRKGQNIDAKLVEDFVLESLQHGSNRDVHRFLETEFEEGKLEGTWFFLFDSFDEIPDVLSSSDADETVNAYSSAISSFLGMTKCRGIIASRYFRAPPSYGLPTFRIVPLSQKRRRELISKADLGAIETRLLETLPAVDPELAALSENPLFLGLLVEYVRDKHELPKGWYDVFEAFVSRRTETDREKLTRLFDISADDLRLRSEEIAFTMTATEGLGLNPKRSDLRAAYQAAGFQNVDQLNPAFDALEWSKLARSEEGVVTSTDPSFTFAHRRFQEYFATRVVLRDPDRISANTLLTNARWRETAVTLCQSQPEQAEALVQRAGVLIADDVKTNADSSVYEWQQGSLHVLGLLQSAFAGNSDPLPRELRENVLSLLELASTKGTITDQKWALEVAGIAPPEAMASMLLNAFRGRSEWLREVAYRQAARLPTIPRNLGVEIRRTLVALAATGQIHAEWPTIKAQVMRLRPMSPFIGAARLLRVAPWIDGIVCAVGFLVVTATLGPSLGGCLLLFLGAILLHLSYYSAASMMTSAGAVLGPIKIPSGLGGMLGTFELLFSVFLLEVRFIAATLPFLYTVSLEPTSELLLSLLWMYTATWSIAATFLCIRRPPKMAVGSILAPFYLIQMAIAAAKRVNTKSAGLAMGTLAIGVILILVITRLPSAVQAVLVVLFGITTALPMLLRFTKEATTTFRDWQWIRRWSDDRPARISASDFLDSLHSLQGSNGKVDYIQIVRAEKLLPSEPDTHLLLQDLLRAISRSRAHEGDSEKSYRSPILKSWINADSNEIEQFAEPEIEDQLGQLLEDLERDKEIPVA
jgi:hypothetical protein